jgi:hypothetical protein
LNSDSAIFTLKKLLAWLTALSIWLTACSWLTLPPPPPTLTAALPLQPEVIFSPTVEFPTQSPNTPTLPPPTVKASPKAQAATQPSTKDTQAPVVLPDIPIPDAEIKFYRPGNLSRVISPFRLVVNVQPGLNDLVWIELIGEDGRELSRKIIKHVTIPGYRTGNLSTNLDFEIEGVAELGRVIVSYQDDFGRVKFLSSVDIILLSTGITKVNGYGDLKENIFIQQPADREKISGGSFFVIGVTRTGADAKIIIEALDYQGEIITKTKAPLSYPQDSGYGLFVGELTYDVEIPTWVRLVVKSQIPRLPGVDHISSVEILLSP